MACKRDLYKFVFSHRTMNYARRESDLRSSRGRVLDHESNNIGTDVIMRKNRTSITTSMPLVEGKKREYQPMFTQLNSRKSFNKSSYFSLESSLLLMCLTASLLILPLILPPLPPPPSLLLLVPIGILALLVILAFMPSSKVSKMSEKYF
ncbi:hypothetical protein AKJ16_DCAP22422 [Drosera capensis]